MNQAPENITNIFERITDAFVALDKNWCYTYLNKKAAAFLNKNPEELIGKNIWQENPEWVGLPFQKAYLRAVEEQKFIYHEEYNEAWDMWFETNIYPSPDGLSVYFRDITERKKAEKKIGDLQSKMDAAIRIGQIGYWDWDIAKDEVFWSDRMYDIYNVDRETPLKYDAVLSRVHPDDRKSHNELVAERIKYKDKTPFEYRVQWPDGSIRHVLVQMEVISNEKDEAIKFQGTVIDITEQRKADNLLECEKRVMGMIATGRGQSEILNTIALNYEFNTNHAICSILLLDEDGIHLRIGAGPNLPDEYNNAIEGVVIDPVVGSCGTAAFTKESVIVSDIENDPLWFDFRDLALRFGLKACWSTPILDNNKKVLGTFAIYYKTIRRPSDEDFILIERTANQVKIAIERYSREAILRKSEERYRSLVEQASDGILVTDMLGNIIDVNSGLCSMFGYAREEVLQKNVALFLDPENLKAQPLRFNMLQGDQPLLLERRAIHKNGTFFEIELNTKLIGEEKTLSIIRNISERKKADKLIRENEERYRTLVENAPEALVVFDVEKRKFVSVSQSAVTLFKMSKEELLKTGPAELSPEYQPDGKLSSESIPVNIKNAIEGGKPFFEWTHCDSKGNLIPCEVRLVRLPSENTILIRGSIIDISERKKTEKEVLEINKQLRSLSVHLQNIREEERTNMAREIHDELGQQLTVMKMDVSWLHKKLQKADATVLQRTEELKNMLDQTMITVRRIASELRPSLLDDMGLGAAIEWHLSEFEKRSGVKTVFDKMQMELPLPDMIKTGLFRIVQESLTNVGRYANAKKVTVSLQHNKGQVVLIIKDNGIGFEKEQIAAKKTLGILGMKERTAIMGGSYNIGSTPGKGTMVTVKIPFGK